ncbi:hypothetical protein ACFWPV_19120 [Streptomyces uncialis]|uniref:hypothetical protein n=1 Tax=Streptomyces uncialis TaxID=1048205 RepID=UPI00365F4FAF
MAHELDLSEVPDLGVGGHRTTTAEQGRFVGARCDCGWRGPARRARSRARSDAEEHQGDPAVR